LARSTDTTWRNPLTELGVRRDKISAHYNYCGASGKCQWLRKQNVSEKFCGYWPRIVTPTMWP